jgi:O-antigen ligase
MLGLLGMGVSAALIAFRPLWGVYLILLLSPLQNLEIGSGLLSLSRIAGAGTILMMLIRFSVRRKHLRLTGIEGPVFLMTLGMSLSFLRTSELMLVASSILSLLSLYALAFLIVNLVENEAQLKGLILLFLASAIYPAGLAIIQWFQAPSYGPYYIFRASGTFTKPTALGGLLLAVVLMAFPLAIYPRISRGLRWLIIGMFGAAVLALILSFTRAAWIGVIMGFGVLLLTPLFRNMSRGLRLSALAVTALVIGALWAFGPLIDQRLVTPTADLVTTGTGEDSVLSRRYETIAGVRIILDNYFLGTGIGNYGKAVWKYDLIYNTTLIPVVPHNIIFYFLGQVGIVGAAGFAWLVAWLYRRVKSHHRHVLGNAGNVTSYVYFGSLACLIGYVSFMIFHSGLFTNEIWVVIASLIVATRLAETSGQ